MATTENKEQSILPTSSRQIRLNTFYTEIPIKAFSIHKSSKNRNRRDTIGTKIITVAFLIDKNRDPVLSL